MSLATAPRAAWRVGLLLVPLLGLPWLGFAFALLDGAQPELGRSDSDLGSLAAQLLPGLALAGWIAIELLAYGLGSVVIRRAATLAQLATAGAVQDFRRAPMSGDNDEIGRLAAAFGRVVRHLAQRRRELEWIVQDVTRQQFVPGVAERAGRLIAPVTLAAQFAADHAEPAESWLHAPQHRLLCALAGAVVVLAAAPLDPAWWAAVAAAALLGGRFAEAPRRLGVPIILPAAATALCATLLLDSPVIAALAAALAAGVAVHCGGGWRGPTGGAADSGWLRGGLAGALAGGGAAAALLGMLGTGPNAALAMALLVTALGLVAASQAPAQAVATPPDWLGGAATWRILGDPAVRSALGGALPGGLALGSAIALATTNPHHAVAAAALAGVLVALPTIGIPPPDRRLRLPAVALLGLAAWLSLDIGAPLASALAAAVAAVFAWPLATTAAAERAAPRQAAILGALLRGVGVVLALAVAPLLPPGSPAGLAAVALLVGARPARQG